jgi:transposase
MSGTGAVAAAACRDLLVQGEERNVRELRLGIDVASREAHRAALVDETGAIVWTNRRFTTGSQSLEALWGWVRAAQPADRDVPVVVIMEPTRNAWAVLAAWLRRRGATVRMVPPEQSADLRKYYNKHTKTDRLDCELLARLPLLHPDGLVATPGLGPAETLRRAVAHRQSLVARRVGGLQRLDALLELLGPGWTAALGTDPGKAALAVLERYADPHALLRLGRARLTRLLIRASRGAWREDKADALLAAARETLRLWPDDGTEAIDFAELADDIAVEARLVRQLGEEIDALDDRISVHYQGADPTGIVASAPGVGVVLAAAILGRLGDATRFRDLAAVRNYTGLVPKVTQSGTVDRHDGLTKAGDHVLRHALFLAADHARKVDPTLAARYARLRAGGKHHNSALCTLAAVLITRIAACWRNHERYVLRDLDGNEITDEQGRAQCAAMKPATASTAKGTGRRSKESHSAPSTGPSNHKPTSHLQTA